MPDALCMLIPSFGILIHVEELRSIMSADAEEDTLITNANGFVKYYGLVLLNVTAQFGTFKGGPALGLLQVTEHLFVVQLLLACFKSRSTSLWCSCASPRAIMTRSWTSIMWPMMAASCAIVIGHGILAGKYLAEYRDSLK